jgi:hypothetical protein
MSGAVFAGRVWGIQVVPPSVVASTTPFEKLGSTPTARQCVPEAQVTLKS